jgi:hypothetical protein
MKLSTVNVIEFANDTVLGMSSWSDDTEGNAEAEKHFADCAKENGFSVDEIEIGLEEGSLENSSGYMVFIVHS